jgi:GNAT superfamily N-acetyltransferase
MEFLDERSPVVGVGPVTIDPAVQNRGVGRRLMRDVMRRAAERGAPGIRLLQSGYHNRSFSLYVSLGSCSGRPWPVCRGRRSSGGSLGMPSGKPWMRIFVRATSCAGGFTASIVVVRSPTR